MIQTENPTQTVLGTRAEPTRRFTVRMGKRWLNMGSGCGAGACFLGLTSTGCFLTASRYGVQRSVGRYQNVRHLLGQPDVLQTVVDGCLAVGVPQQAEVGATACLLTQAKVPADGCQAAVGSTVS